MMSDAHADFLNGLHVVEYELERLIGELDEMQDRNGIPTLDRVRLDTLQWALNKLADDLHDASDEILTARLEVVAARRGAEDAREVRDAACQLHLFECRKHSAEVERRLALEKQLAEVTAERDEARQQQQAEQLQWASFYNGLGAELHKVKAERDGLQRQVAELTEKLGELPDEEDEPFPEPYPWQDGDTVSSRDVKILPYDCLYKVKRLSCGRVALIGLTGMLSQADWEKHGFTLNRKASDLPDLPSPTPQQVAEFPAVAEPIDDNTDTDGEGRP